jgi:hypothetical protein
MKIKLTVEHLRDYALPQRRITAQRYADKLMTAQGNTRVEGQALSYWRGYENAIKSLEDLIKDNEEV